MPKLERFAGTLGFHVEYGDCGTARGWCDIADIRIAERASNGKAKTLVHELAHAQGVDYTDYPREVAEVIVESAAAIVCGALGFRTDSESVPYIAHWSDGDPTAIEEYAAKIDELASRLEAAAGVGRSS